MKKTSLSVIILLIFAMIISSCDGPNNGNGNNTQNPPTPTGQVVDVMPKSSKRGVSFSFTNIMDLPLLSPYISWDYNWGNTPTEDAAIWFDANEMDFCPMCWNGNYSKDRIRAYVAAHPNTKYLLAFNEPNLTDQANMTPAQAAALWPDVVALAKELNLKLVSPAMNYGTLSGYSNPIKWLDDFFAQPGVSIDDIYAISIHCYMSSPNAVQNYVKMFAKYNKPVWLTEFCAWDPVPGNVEVQKDYMCAVLNFLESEPLVERYAWFIPRSSAGVDKAPYMQLLTHDWPPVLTPLGEMYCHLSPMDTTVWLKATRPILAHEYAKLKNTFMTLRPSNDSIALTQAGYPGLMITNFAAGQEISYQVYLPADANQLTLRYCGYSNSICEVLIDGQSANFIDMPRNGSSDQWITATTTIPIKAGCHTITLSLFSGSCSLSALEIK